LALFRNLPGIAPLPAVLQNLAAIAAERGDRERAIRLRREALALLRRCRSELDENIGLNLLHIARLKSPSDGRPELLRGFAILCACKVSAPHAAAYRLLAEGFLVSCRDAAIFFDKLALNILQGLRLDLAGLRRNLDHAFIGARQDAYRDLGESLIADGRLPEAQQVLAMIKERELLQLTRGVAVSPGSKVALTPFEQRWADRLETMRTDIVARRRDDEREPEARIAHEHRLISASVAEVGAFLDGLTLAFQALEANNALPLNPGLDTRPDGIKLGAALIQYLVAKDRLRIIVTTPVRQRSFVSAVAESELNALVYAFRAALQERSPEFIQMALRLHQLLIKPVVAELKSAGASTLSISLDGALRYVPLSALYDGKRFLVEDFNILVGTSAADVPKLSYAPSTPTGIGLGTSEPAEGLPPLLSVQEELFAVIRTQDHSGGVLPGIVKLDRDFTLEALREAGASNCRAVHIASHFVFEAATEASSYLQLGQGERLTLQDLTDLRFNGMELVVLSACDTAVTAGHHQGGHEVEGLGALVRRQGAQNVVATLWPVADHSSADLMQAFYRGWYESGLSLSEALRQAQLAALRGSAATLRAPARGFELEEGSDAAESRVSHPFFWAPYILMGEALFGKR
jgi:CHAT domain-containing protein